MTERPIIFNGEMVRAILDGRKTQTRRVIRVQPPDDRYELSTLMDSTSSDRRRYIGKQHWILRDGYHVVYDYETYFSCPYGQPGDHLWVRETISRVRRPTGEWMYRADYPVDIALAYKWKPSIHMRRDQSRITLEITNVRVERVQDISARDVRSEGLIQKNHGVLRSHIFGLDEWPEERWRISPIDAFQWLWDSINAERGYGWDQNPWVWVVEFRRVTP